MNFSIFDELDSILSNDPEILHERVAYGIFETIEFIAYGLSAVEKFEPEEFSPPSAGFTFWTGHDPDASTLPTRFGQWLTTVGLRRFIEIYSEYLVKVIGLVEARSGRAKRSETAPRIASFSQKLQRVRQELKSDGNLLERKFGKQLRSLNKARNQLEHNRGIVTSDSNYGRPLIIRWKERRFKAIPPTSDEPEVLRATYQMIDVQKRVMVGDEIAFNPSDFTSIGQTFADHAMLVTRSLTGQDLDDAYNTTWHFQV